MHNSPSIPFPSFRRLSYRRRSIRSTARSGRAEPPCRSGCRCRSGKAFAEVELVPRDEEEPVAARATQRLRRAVERRPMPAARAHAVMIAPAFGQAHRLVGTAHHAPAARGSGGDELEQRGWYRHRLVIHLEDDLAPRARRDPIPRAATKRVGRFGLEACPLDSCRHGPPSRRPGALIIGRPCRFW